MVDMLAIALLEMGIFNLRTIQSLSLMWTQQLETLAHLPKTRGCTTILAAFFRLNGQINMVVEETQKSRAKLSSSTPVRILWIPG